MKQREKYLIERPLDFLNQLKNQEVKIVFKGREGFKVCTLLAFDIHINLCVRTEYGYEFIRGENVLVITDNIQEEEE